MRTRCRSSPPSVSSLSLRPGISERILSRGYLELDFLFQSHPEMGLVTTPVSPAPTTPATPLGTTPPSSDGKLTISFVLINMIFQREHSCVEQRTQLFILSHKKLPEILSFRTPEALKETLEKIGKCFSLCKKLHNSTLTSGNGCRIMEC